MKNHHSNIYPQRRITVKTTDQTVWLLYDVLEDKPSQTENRDIAIDARNIRFVWNYHVRKNEIQFVPQTKIIRQYYDAYLTKTNKIIRNYSVAWQAGTKRSAVTACHDEKRKILHYYTYYT
jgi:hypothetical protein